MKLLRMKEIYIFWAKQGKKTATTRLRLLPLGEPLELVSGSYFKPKKSGVVVVIKEVFSWTLDSITEELKLKIIKLENFKTWEEFVKVLEEINKKKKIDFKNAVWKTHIYEVVSQ